MNKVNSIHKKIPHHRFIKFFIILSLVFILIILYSIFGKKISPKTALEPGFFKISSFYDGDTIGVSMNGQEEKVRFIGIDTPETHKPNTPVQCYGEEASKNTKKIIEASGKVRLEADSLGTNRDRYGRLLRYVYLPDGTLLNAKLVQEGFAFAYTAFPFEKLESFQNLEKLARDSNFGLWGVCHPQISGGMIRSNIAQ